ncbi:MAG: hypothetical protein IKL88_00710, partial [Erysipelotrichales bacterium]|nr:hypothetical protein [Erysipelotrichales bacterium]
MDIEHKKIYGKLIEHYREEYQQKYGSDKWGIEQFLHIKGKYDRICSRTTYYHMRTDRTVNDQIYIDLIRNLGLKYKEFPMIDNALEGVFLELHSSVLKMENDKLLRLREHINSLFAEARKYFYYNDVYKLLIFLIELHTDRLRDYSLEEREHLSNVSFILSNFDFN